MLETDPGSATLPVMIDAKLRSGHVAVPNGFGIRYVAPDGSTAAPDGLNLNELTAVGDRDPFTGCPYHKTVVCRVSPA